MLSRHAWTCSCTHSSSHADHPSGQEPGNCRSGRRPRSCTDARSGERAQSGEVETCCGLARPWSRRTRRYRQKLCRRPRPRTHQCIFRHRLGDQAREPGYRPLAHKWLRVMIVRAFAGCSVTGGALLAVDLLTGADRSGGGHAGKQHRYEPRESNPSDVVEMTHLRILIGLHRKVNRECAAITGVDSRIDTQPGGIDHWPKALTPTIRQRQRKAGSITYT